MRTVIEWFPVVTFAMVALIEAAASAGLVERETPHWMVAVAFALLAFATKGPR